MQRKNLWVRDYYYIGLRKIEIIFCVGSVKEGGLREKRYKVGALKKNFLLRMLRKKCDKLFSIVYFLGELYV